jgi:calcineurin-like phosphoesterase family protein
MRLNSLDQQIWITSDLHLGHTNILKFQKNRNFNNIEEMDQHILYEWESKVGPNDIVFVLGDVSWYPVHKTAGIIQSLPGHKILIRGNHDKFELKPFFDQSFEYLTLHIDGIPIIMFHFPIHDWDRRHHGSFHLHGHTHGSLLSDNRRKDVGLDANSKLTLFNWEEIKTELLTKPYPKKRYEP